MPARLWTDLTVEEFAQALGETSTALLPLGVTEQHGFHLPLNVDILNCEMLTRRASEQTGALVAPTLNYAFSGGELPGTINISPAVYSAFVGELIREIFRQGIRNLVLVPGHGGTDNSYAIRNAAEMFLRLNPQYADRNLALFYFWEYSPTFQSHAAKGDFHAAETETSLMLHWAGELVRTDRVVLDEPEFAELMRSDQDAFEARKQHVNHPAIIARRYQSPRMKVGVMGYPELATAELGEVIATECVAGLVELIRKLEES
ncbi:MAG TPA: creatininase family protein [Armatimonadota bacterium]|jgi:creatinine amidohydrolase